MLEKRARRAFAKFDADKDGGLTKEELAAALEFWDEREDRRKAAMRKRMEKFRESRKYKNAA